MKNIVFKTHIQPHLLAVLTFLVVVVLFFHPYFFGGKVLSQHDILQWEGAAHELIEFRKQTGEEGLWANSMFSGMPAYLINVEWSNQPIMWLQKLIGVGLPHPIRIIFFSCLSFYIALLCFRVRSSLAMAGALAFAFSSFMMIGLGAGHNARIAAIGLMPLVLGGIHLTLSGKRLLGMALTATALALHIRFNHLQITYYLVLVVTIYGLIQLYAAVKEGKIKDFMINGSLLIVSALLALGTFFGIFSATYEYSQYSMRGKSELVSQGQEASEGLEKDYAFQYSNGIFEPLTLFIPNFFGGSSQQALSKNSNLAKALRDNGLSSVQIQQQIEAVPTYWGDQPLTAPYYAGAIVVFLFVLGILFVEKKYTLWAIIVVALGIALSWGSNFETFNYFMFDYFPGYNKFRSVTFALCMALLLMPLLGFMGLERLLSQPFGKENQKKLFIALGITGGFALLAMLLAGMGSYRGAIDARLGNLPEWFMQALRDDRKSLLRTDAFRSLVFIALVAGVIWVYFKGKLQEKWAMVLIVVLTTADVALVSNRYLNEKSFGKDPSREFFAATDADLLIKKDPSPHYRVLNLQNPWNDARTSYHHHSLGGYHGAKIRRYQDLISSCIDNELQELISNYSSGNTSFASYGVLNMLNAKYLLTGSSSNSVVRNPSALGNAWLVAEVQKVNNPNEELAALCQVSTEKVAVVDQSKFQLANQYSDSGQVMLTSYKPNQLEYAAELAGNSLVVFSEIYYEKGWKAYIDNQEAPIHRVNYVLRALEVPSGKHEIRFEFVPEVYETGNAIMMASSWLLLLLLLGAIGLEIKKVL
ncbi:YfhO family protein [Cytophagales bacterium LB-30]|uniref:YfhO family protein n=1 Tax=Shiella aurantiaca TaxID=3058365 RepID=A0ABT8F1X8_9BACT|nr:YfhO family protein [Shiella aurantiaca]MDN4164417.1 YfhO family protein [Shiella aurantiaca]